MSYDGSIKIDTKLDTSGVENGLSKLKNIAKVGFTAGRGGGGCGVRCSG